MAMCDDCAGIETGKRGAPGHDRLEETGASKASYPQGTIHYTKHRCTVCGTKWEYESDKNDDHAGWSVLD